MLTPTAIQIAAALTSIHHHDEATGEIIYKEKELIPMLQKLGWPQPDFEGNEKFHAQWVADAQKAFLELHPGNLIAECIEQSTWSDERVARFLEITEAKLDEILHKGGLITPSLAKGLELLFKKPASEWLEMQDKYLTEFNRVFGTKS